MRILPIIRMSPLLPFAWMDSFRYSKKEKGCAYKKCQWYSNMALKMMGYPLVINGLENVIDNDGVMFVCNHQGTIDPALICASSPLPLSFISKKENENLPILGRWAKNIGTIHFDRDSMQGNVSMLRQTLRMLKDKQNVLIFAEGTRSKKDAMNPFKEKALQAAMMAKATIIPVSISGAYCLDRLDVKIKELRIVYDKPIEYASYKTMNEAQLSEQVHTIIEKNIVKMEVF